jgi:predicted RNA-binding Zn ribbon-like protein
MTEQVELESYADVGVLVSVDLVNALVIEHPFDQLTAAAEALPAIARILSVDQSSLAQLGEGDAAGFVALAREMHGVFDDLHRGDVDCAAGRLNHLLADHPAHPHLTKEHGRWRLHHHPVDAALALMWTSICAEAAARMIGAGHAGRFGACEATGCERVFVDVSKNASRRFCSTTCQNRAKAAVFRRRRVAPT